MSSIGNGLWSGTNEAMLLWLNLVLEKGSLLAKLFFSICNFRVIIVLTLEMKLSSWVLIIQSYIGRCTMAQRDVLFGTHVQISYDRINRERDYRALSPVITQAVLMAGISWAGIVGMHQLQRFPVR
jgi:hypothetical protein